MSWLLGSGDEPLHIKYQKIQEAIDSESWEVVISICDKILSTTPDDKDAWACKISALIKNYQISEAIEEINVSPDQEDFRFEHAYCLYREKNPKALEVLENCPKDEKYRVLKAQINDMLERLSESSKILENVKCEEKEVIKEVIVEPFPTSVPVEIVKSEEKEKVEEMEVIPPNIVSPEVKSEEKVIKKRRPKKKKKNKLPKNFNPNVKPDPDRWKPKHLRAGYRPKKTSKIPNSRGIQGSATVSQAQQLADTGVKGAQPLKNAQPVQPKEVVPTGPTDAQRKAQAAAQAATSAKTNTRGKGGGGNKRRGKK